MTPGFLPTALNELLPPLQSCDRLPLDAGDIVIHAPGFEDRTMAVASVVTASPGVRAILLDYLPYDSNNRLSDVRGALSARGIEIADEDILTYNRFAPGDFETRLLRCLRAHGFRRVVIDISTMSKLEIMLILNVCRKVDLSVRVFYCEADTYRPSQEEFETARQRNKIHQPTLQIFTGVHGVVRVDSLASVAMQGQPTAAIVFMSLNDALTQALLNTVYPSRLFLINGRPPVHAWREEATAWIHDQVRREWEEDNPVHPAVEGKVAMPKRIASTLYYRETVSVLLQLYWQLSADHRILLAPAGSKLQAVGSYLVKALHPDIHIEYPSPEGFFSDYSSGVGPRWLLNLGRLSELLEAVSDAERREFLEIPT
jgi:hypothetical protein